MAIFLFTFIISFITCIILASIMNASFACTVVVSAIVVVLFAYVSGNSKGGRR